MRNGGWLVCLGLEGEDLAHRHRQGPRQQYAKTITLFEEVGTRSEQTVILERVGMGVCGLARGCCLACILQRSEHTVLMSYLKVCRCSGPVLCAALHRRHAFCALRVQFVL